MMRGKFKVRFGEAPKPATEAVALPSKGRTRCDNQTAMNTSAVRPQIYPDCKQATLQTSSKNDSRVWEGAYYSRSVAA
jgi:hypothetical protein